MKNIRDLNKLKHITEGRLKDLIFITNQTIARFFLIICFF